jgi:high-affinity nickel-transport protein
MATVGLGIFVAGAVGLVEFLQVISSNAKFRGHFWSLLNRLNFETLGYFIVGVFIVLWIAAVVSYRFFHFEERYGSNITVDPFATKE